MKTKLSVAVVFCLLATLQVAKAQNAQAAEIKAARERSNRAIAARDLETFSESLTDDFVMVRGSGAFVQSRDAYIALFRQDFADPTSTVYQRICDKIEISNAAPLAAEHGHWVGKVKGKSAYSGTYLAMWRHTAAGWKIRSELFVVLTCGDAEICKDYAAGGNNR